MLKEIEQRTAKLFLRTADFVCCKSHLKAQCVKFSPIQGFYPGKKPNNQILAGSLYKA